MTNSDITLLYNMAEKLIRTYKIRCVLHITEIVNIWSLVSASCFENCSYYVLKNILINIFNMKITYPL
jgi:hypothetical protein